MKNNRRNLLKTLKDSASTLWPQLTIRINGFPGYYLRIVPTDAHSLDKADVSLLTNLRNRYVKSFLTEFLANDIQTSDWLTNNVHFDDSRILFIIEDESHKRLGYMGLAYIDWELCYAEADAIVSGGETPKGLMSSALMTLLYWAKNQLLLQKIGVRVLSDNPALSFYRKLGFKESRRVPLKSILNEELTTWIEDESIADSKRYLVHHLWDEQNEEAFDVSSNY